MIDIYRLDSHLWSMQSILWDAPHKRHFTKSDFCVSPDWEQFPPSKPVLRLVRNRFLDRCGLRFWRSVWTKNWRILWAGQFVGSFFLPLLVFSVVVAVVFFLDLMLVGWQNGRMGVGGAMAWQFLCCYCCCCYGGCCCLLLLGIMCWWDGRMAEWLWAVPWPMPLKPHTERRQEFGQGRTTYLSQAAPNIGEGNLPI